VRDVGTIHAFAVVAEGRRGLTFANFADPDLARQAPAITFDPAALDADATLPSFATYDGPGDFSGLFPAGTTFRALGQGSRLTLSDMTSASGPVNWNARGAPALSFEATSGGRLELPALTSLSQRVKLRADGDGSVLAAPVLTSVNGSEEPFPAGISASANALIQAPALTTLVNCPITEQNGGVVQRP
jgi:hypothetical protein